ncbi:MAG TPA: hypothetical protein VG734_14285 [Lacunisphaera sp.]|nr:hypothetical protein [Lacunisphaera sp.]
MNLLKIIFAVFMAIAVLTVFGKIRQKFADSGSAPTCSAKAGKELSPAGFFLLSRDDAKNPRVTIMSPPNCPSHEAQRARVLESALTSAGIPCEMKSEIAFTFTDPAEADRVNQFMSNVANPLVLVRGWAKGNPMTEDVIAQYRSGQ